MKYDSEYDEQYILYLMSILAQIDGLFSFLSDRVASLVFPYLSTDAYFSFQNHGKPGKKIAEIIRDLSESLIAQTTAAISFAWGLSGKKNDVLVAKVFETVLKTQKIPKVYISPNTEGLNRFRTRKVHGLRLSDRVWKYTETLQTELEQALNAAIEKGMSAAQLSKGIKMYLKNPDALYRRVRDKNANLLLSKSALRYHPGQGVYRSAYKNAMRLARTEINKAYRRADFERWQQLPFVTGFKIKTTDRKFNTCDLCTLLQGIYPKDFCFAGWHPQCLCICTPVMISEKQMKQMNETILNGENPPEFAQPDMPVNFSKWYESAKLNPDSLPDWYLDNKGLLSKMGR
jgi:hypothetical protein